MRQVNPKIYSYWHDKTSKNILQVNDLCLFTSNNVVEPQYVVVLGELIEIFK